MKNQKLEIEISDDVSREDLLRRIIPSLKEWFYYDMMLKVNCLISIPKRICPTCGSTTSFINPKHFKR